MLPAVAVVVVCSLSVSTLWTPRMPLRAGVCRNTHTLFGTSVIPIPPQRRHAPRAAMLSTSQRTRSTRLIHSVLQSSATAATMLTLRVRVALAPRRRRTWRGGPTAARPSGRGEPARARARAPAARPTGQSLSCSRGGLPDTSPGLAAPVITYATRPVAVLDSTVCFVTSSTLKGQDRGFRGRSGFTARSLFEQLTLPVATLPERNSSPPKLTCSPRQLGTRDLRPIPRVSCAACVGAPLQVWATRPWLRPLRLNVMAMGENPALTSCFEHSFVILCLI